MLVLDAGALVAVERADRDVVALIKDCLAEVRDTATEKTIDLTLRSPKTMPGVITDARLLVRVVRELVSNAVRFTPKGGRVSLGLNVTPQHPLLVRWYLRFPLLWRILGKQFLIVADKPRDDAR